jgi:hypothetical protein
LINTLFFEKMFEKITTEPLVRVYCSCHSHKNTEVNILFDVCCFNPVKDMSAPWYVDLSSDKFLELMSRFQDQEFDPKQLKQLNLNDFNALQFRDN